LIQDLARDVGDFVLRRADGVHAYQLAVVVDDAFQNVNQVVRGADLMLSSPRQIHLHRLLGLEPPVYAHVPLALDAAGRKLSKSDAAAPVDPKAPLPALIQAWAFLGQLSCPEPPGKVEQFWEFARCSWDLDRVPRLRSAPIPRRVSAARDQGW
jgi:glutamyl-Q tRNA(Asp) synthetase